MVRFTHPSAATALSEHTSCRRLTLCALYFAQGLPYGFMTVALISHLTENHMSLENTGWLLTMCTMPWTFKLLWAPIIDSVTLRSMGRRRPWILFAQSMMTLTMLTIIGIGDILNEITLLGWMFFLHNCFASLQDVSTDALAVDILADDERGRVNGLMWGSKILGVGFGTAAIGSLLARTNLEVALLAQTVVLLSIMLLPLCYVERPGDQRFPWSRKPASSTNHHQQQPAVRAPQRVVADLLRALSVRPAFLALVFTTIIHVAQGTNATLITPLYTQQLGWTGEHYAQVDGVLGTGFQMLAALLGGYLGDRYGQRVFMVAGYSGFSFLAIAFGLMQPMWTNHTFATAYMVLAPAALAMGTVSGFSLYMRISWTEAAATMFTCYMALLNVGDVLGKGFVATQLHGRYDYATCFWMLGLIGLVPLVLVPWMDPSDVEAAKRLDLEAA